MLVSASEAARVFGISTSALYQWPVEPVEEDKRGRRYDLRTLIEHRYGGGSDEGGPPHVRLARERARLTEAQRLRIEREEAVATGELLEVDAVVEHWSNALVHFRAKMLGLRALIMRERTRGGSLESIRDDCERYINEALGDLASFDPIPPESAEKAKQSLQSAGTAARPNGQSMGGQRKTPKPRKRSRARKVAN